MYVFKYLAAFLGFSIVILLLKVSIKVLGVDSDTLAHMVQAGFSQTDSRQLSHQTHQAYLKIIQSIGFLTLLVCYYGADCQEINNVKHKMLRAQVSLLPSL